MCNARRTRLCIAFAMERRAKWLQNNGGPTQTPALPAGTPAFDDNTLIEPNAMARMLRQFISGEVVATDHGLALAWTGQFPEGRARMGLWNVGSLALRLTPLRTNALLVNHRILYGS